MADIENENDEVVVSFLDLVKACVSRIGLIIGLAVMGIGCAILYIATSTPVYESSASIIVSPIQNASSIESLYSSLNTTSSINTEVDLIKSRTNLRNALESLDLSKYSQGEEGVETFDMMQFSDQALAEMVTVSVTSNSRGVTIKVKSTDRRFAADYADAVASSFRDQLSSIATESKASQKSTIEEQISINEGQLAQARADLLSYSSQNKVAELDGKIAMLANQLSSINLSSKPLEMQKDEAARIIESKTGEDAQALCEEVSANEGISLILSDYRDTLKEYMLYQTVTGSSATERVFALSSKLDSQSVALMNAIAEIGKAAPVAKSVCDMLCVAVRQNVAASIVEDYEEQLSQAQQVVSRLSELETDVQLYESLSLSLKELLEETRMLESAVEGTNVTIVDKAVVSGNAVSPHKLAALVIGCMLGAVIGVMIVVISVCVDKSVKTEDAVVGIMGDCAPSLGWIPFSRHTDSDGSAAVLKNGSSLFVLDQDSYVAERYRILASNILFTSKSGDGDCRVLVVNSTDAREGKTTCTCNLAITYALLGKKVLVIDGDLRRPEVERVFNIRHDASGLTDVLVGNTSLENCVIRPIDDVPSLHFLPSGKKISNPNIIFNSAEFKGMISGLRGMYDIVFIDCPPLSFGSDFTILSSVVDGIVYLVRAGISTTDSVLDFKKSLEFLKAPLLGFVLYGVLRSQRGYGYGYGYGYGNYGYGSEKKCKKRLFRRDSYKKLYDESNSARTEKIRKSGERTGILAFADGKDKAFGNPGKSALLNADKAIDFLSEIEDDEQAKGKK